MMLCSLSTMRVYKFLSAHFGLKSLSERRLKISTLEDLNDPFELLPYSMADRTLRIALRATRDEMARNHGVVCFSANWRDPVVWAHYADKHKGLCLGFVIPDERCKRVKYVAKRLSLRVPPTLVDAQAMLFTKYENWKYEEEIRVWTTLNDIDQGLYFADFGENLRLVTVILGARCTVTKKEIVEVLRGPSTDISFVKARAGFREFEIVRDRRGPE